MTMVGLRGQMAAWVRFCGLVLAVAATGLAGCTVRTHEISTIAAPPTVFLPEENFACNAEASAYIDVIRLAVIYGPSSPVFEPALGVLRDQVAGCLGQGEPAATPMVGLLHASARP